VSDESHRDLERLAELLRRLPPPPAGWADAAKDLPLAFAELDGIVARARVDAEFRHALLADLEGAAAEAGFRRPPRFTEELLRRLR
jgi:hypothetical protein